MSRLLARVWASCSLMQGIIAASVVISSVCSSLAVRRLLFIEQRRRARWKTTAQPCPVLDSCWWPMNGMLRPITWTIDVVGLATGKLESIEIQHTARASLRSSCIRAEPSSETIRIRPSWGPCSCTGTDTIEHIWTFSRNCWPHLTVLSAARKSISVATSWSAPMSRRAPRRLCVTFLASWPTWCASSTYAITS